MAMLMEYQEILTKIQSESENRIHDIHHFAKKMWKDQNYSPIDIQNRCLDTWEELASNLDCKISPLIPLRDELPPSNVIFGSGSFSTGKFQVEQFNRVKQYASTIPVNLMGLVSNKSQEHGCNAEVIHRDLNIPLIQLDYTDWYHEYIDKLEKNPIRATRYWFDKDDETRPSLAELSRRFKIRQNNFHKELGEKIYGEFKEPIDIVSARGYNFQFCSNLFPHQKNHLPHINDTHPADLTYLDVKTKAKLYAGWQSGAIEKMLADDVHKQIRGSLIEVDYMDSITQINELDEGVLLALSEGIKIKKESSFTSKQIQDAMKIMDDYFYCSLEPTGLILFWGVTDKPVPVVYQDLHGNPIVIKEKAVVVGDHFHSGIHAWGKNLKQDLAELRNFLHI